MGANELTKAVIDFLTLNKCFVWRQNNLTAPGRRFTGLKGVPDIIGLSGKGRPLAIEIKFGKDRQSEYQKKFQENWQNHFGIYFIISNFDDIIKLKETIDILDR